MPRPLEELSALDPAGRRLLEGGDTRTGHGVGLAAALDAAELDQPVGIRLGVVVDEGHEVGAVEGHGQRGVARLRDAAPLLDPIADRERQPALCGPADLPGGLVGIVVHHDQAQLGRRIGQAQLLEGAEEPITEDDCWSLQYDMGVSPCGVDLIGSGETGS